MQFTSKLNILKIFLFCMIGFATLSCKSYYTSLTIETPRPAKDELPADIQSLTLMNRSMSDQFQMHQEDSLQIYFYRNGYQLSVVVLDSLAADTTIRALAELMIESGRYDVAVPIERNIPRNLHFDSIPEELNPEQVSQLCSQFNTDALMVLEKFSTKVMTDNSTYKYVDKYTGTSYTFYATLDLKYDAMLRIYKPGSIVREIHLSDTIYWESTDDNQVRMFSRLPSIKQAVITAAIKIALDVDGKISPFWIPEKRGYFLFDLKNDQGQQLINENKMEQAIAFWNEKAKSDDKKIKSRAEYNLAVASELEGNVDLAIEWGLKSFNTRYDYRTEVYLKKLEALKEDQQSQ